MIRVEKRDVARALLTPSPASLEIAPGLWAVRVLSALEAASLVLHADASPLWLPAVIDNGANMDAATRKAEVLPDELFGMRGNAYGERLAWATAELAERHAPRSALQEIQLVRYAVGGKYVDHRDELAEGEARRALSIVLYLDNACTGGETVFPGLGIVVPPMTGIAIAFSPSLLHRADPVTGGTKHIITAWYNL